MRTVFIEGDCNVHTCDDYARRFVAICNYDHIKSNEEYFRELKKAKELADQYRDIEKEKQGWETLVDEAPPEAWEALKFVLYDEFMSTQEFAE